MPIRRTINEVQIKNLASLGFMEQAENIVFLGSSGVGKTHLATSLGIKSSRNRRSTYLIKCHDLIQNLKSAKDEGRIETRLKHYARYQLLIIDEIGYLPLQPGDANLLFQIIDRRYEKKSTIVISNINFDEWATILHDERVANAIVDRLLHHPHVISITGDSYRLRNHMQQKE
ncbi:IS21-like element helper ATPase IstB [Veillonella atypica]|uniref:IS21-like element helper ATPase IstB n=1 Tax=Veillonella atypica TaxID=39777 RepID=UPI00352E97EA